MKIRVSTLLSFIDQLVAQNLQVQTGSGALPRIRVPVYQKGCDEVYFDFKPDKAGKVSADMSILYDGETVTYPVNDFIRFAGSLPVSMIQNMKGKCVMVYCKKTDSCVTFEFLDSMPNPEWFLVG